MGIDAGFDMVPRLSKGAVDRQNWQSFMDVVKEIYHDDGHVDLKPNYIGLKIGEHPLLPVEGHKFLRFSSKISGTGGAEVEEYIKTVARVARAKFGSRVQFWHEGGDNYGFYNCKDVHESLRTYEQPDRPKTPTSIAEHVSGNDPVSDLSLPLFEIQSLPGKGKGLVARINIANGQRILYQKPLLTTSNISSIHAMEDSIARKL